MKGKRRFPLRASTFGNLLRRFELVEGHPEQSEVGFACGSAKPFDFAQGERGGQRNRLYGTIAVRFERDSFQ